MIEETTIWDQKEQSLFNKVPDLQGTTLLKTDSNTGVFL